uniref:Uncharacterized protein n=1 Tax=Oryza rufipogon TaxID=4529 RepID=A0A0E0R7C4_ORYRU
MSFSPPRKGYEMPSGRDALHLVKSRVVVLSIRDASTKMRCRPSVMLSLFVEINAVARPHIGASLVYVNMKKEWCRL